MKYNEQLESLRSSSLYRKREPFRRQGMFALDVNNNSLHNFSSNDYLGLADHPDICRAIQEAVSAHGAGSGSSAYVCGYHPLHEQVELFFSQFVDRDRSVLFANGYTANLAVQLLLGGKGCKVYMDRLCHASIIDGARMSGTKINRFNHLDYESLAAMLKQAEDDKRHIVTDSVFSMDGDQASLIEIDRLSSEHDVPWIVDDAHGFGVMGINGKGALHITEPGLKPLLHVTPLGKAAGCYGAFVSGDEATIEMLIQVGRPLIYSTAMPPAFAAGIQASLRLIEAAEAQRERLSTRIQLFRAAASKMGLQLGSSTTAIQPVLIGDEKQCLVVSRKLREAGFLVAAIRPPTVPAGTSRIRISLSSAHTDDQINALIEKLAAALDSVK